MLSTILLIIILKVSGALSLQSTSSCENNYTCLPLSECEEVREIIDKGGTLNYTRSLFCGYFHEPYVCCDKDCITPNGNYGKSIPLENCTHLKSNIESTDRKRRKFLAESQIDKINVCCNKGENTYKSVPPAPITSRNETAKPSNSSCITLNGEQAKCVHISECEVYKKRFNGTDKEFRYVNESFCGWWKEPMVCCGDTDRYKENYVNKLPNLQECGKWNDTSNPNITPPWLAMIEQVNTKEICVGALINQEYVLSSIKCTGKEHKTLNIKIGECINSKNAKDCNFQVRELKSFPRDTYLPAEDLGAVLIKLNQSIKVNDVTPVCLPRYELALTEEVRIMNLEKLGGKWLLKQFTTLTIDNNSCYDEMKFFYEKIICLRSKYICQDTKMQFLQSIVLINADNRWYLEGVFNKDSKCYGFSNDYFNAMYVYKFVPWIKSNIS